MGNYVLLKMKQCAYKKRMVRKIRTIDFEELRVFAMVAHHGGITPAANVLGIAKSTISHSLTRLEERIGARLFERNSRRVALTQEGTQVLPRVLSLLAEVDSLLEETARTTAAPRGIVRIAVPTALGSAVLEYLVPSLRERFPEIALVVVPGYEMDDLQDPAFDFAIRAGAVRDETLVASKVGAFFRILVCAPEHAAASAQSVDDLKDFPLLGFSNRTPRVEWILRSVSEPDREIVVEAKASLSVQDFETLLRMARAGHGVAEVPSFMAKDAIANGRLVHVLPEWTSPPVDVMLAYRFGVSRVSRVAAVLDVARDAIAEVLRQRH
jgi:DNA-binding transcriptional LysR family regulator